MIDYKGKLFTFLSILLMIYLVYQVNRFTGNMTPPQDVLSVPTQHGQFHVVLDDAKKDASIFERILLYFYENDIKQKAVQDNIRQIQNSPHIPMLKSVTVMRGMKVRVQALDLAKFERNPEQKPEIMVVTIGEDDKLPAEIQEKMIGLQAGQVVVLESDSQRFRIEVLELSVQTIAEEGKK